MIPPAFLCLARDTRRPECCGQGIQRSRSGFVRSAPGLKTPDEGKKLAERKGVVCAAEGCRGRDVRPRSFAQTGNCVVVGLGRIGLSGRLLELFADGRGETRLSQNMAPLRGQDSRATLDWRALASEGDIRQGKVFHAKYHHRFFLASAARRSTVVKTAVCSWVMRHWILLIERLFLPKSARKLLS